MNTRLAVSVLLLAAGAVHADYLTGFEPPAVAASAPGVALTGAFGGGGQDGWYNPVAGSVAFNAHSYAGNSMGFPANPNGGQQFVGATGSAAAGSIGRAQHNVSFAGGGTWTAEWDVIGATTTGQQLNNLGSFSLQPTTNNYFQTVMLWAGTGLYNINYSAFPVTGGGAPSFATPGPAWFAIPVNHWIRQSTTWDFTSNKILSVSIQDITAGGPLTTADVSGFDWYLFGGANNALGLPLPTDIRLFTGNIDNATGWDNVSVVPAPASLALLGLSGLVGARRRRR